MVLAKPTFATRYKARTTITGREVLEPETKLEWGDFKQKGCGEALEAAIDRAIAEVHSEGLTDQDITWTDRTKGATEPESGRSR